VLESLRIDPAGKGERLGGFVYGTIIVLAVIAASAKAYPTSPEHVIAVVAITTVVFWLAHVYAHGLGHAVNSGEHLTLAELRHIARHEAALVEAALPCLIPIVLAAFGVLKPATAYWIAFFIGLAVLVFNGWLFARSERMGALGTILVVTLNLALGLILVAMKIIVTH
jgi:hypothetical protein